MMSITVCFPVCAILDDIGAAWSKARKQLNYLVSKKRKAAPRWLGFDLSGALEVMPFTLDELPIMGSNQQELLAAIGNVRPQFDGAPLWLPHMHAIVHAPGVEWQEVRDALQEVWPHAFQVKVEPFYPTKGKQESIESLAFYQMKYEPGRLIGNNVYRWPVSWMADLYEWAYSFSRSYQSFKFSIGRRKRISIDDTLRGIQKRVTEDRISKNHILYTDSSAFDTLKRVVVNLPVNHLSLKSCDLRLEMKDWCAENFEAGWRCQWLVSEETARFAFTSEMDAVAFKLRFSELLSGP